MSAIVTAGSGFLLAVLWFDLMFDVQVLRHPRDSVLPDRVLASIAAYYRRVTTDARPMNRLIAVVMLATLVAIVIEIAGDDVPNWVGWTSLPLAAGPIALAATHTFPAAVRLGTRAGSAEAQSRLARAACRDHLACLAGIAALMAVQLGFAT